MAIWVNVNGEAHYVGFVYGQASGESIALGPNDSPGYAGINGNPNVITQRNISGNFFGAALSGGVLSTYVRLSIEEPNLNLLMPAAYFPDLEGRAVWSSGGASAWTPTTTIKPGDPEWQSDWDVDHYAYYFMSFSDLPSSVRGYFELRTSWADITTIHS